MVSFGYLLLVLRLQPDSVAPVIANRPQVAQHAVQPLANVAAGNHRRRFESENVHPSWLGTAPPMTNSRCARAGEILYILFLDGEKSMVFGGNVSVYGSKATSVQRLS